MGVTKTVLQEGSGPQPTPGQTVTIEYTGWLKDTSKPDNKGDNYPAIHPVPALPTITTMTASHDLQFKETTAPRPWFDSSVGRGDFVTRIGVGQVIKGWDEGVTQMKVGEKATLDISSDYGYGARGFTGHIPPNADLIFDVHLKKTQ
ncbi:hypothetical protein GQX73_g7204 [Xylaria multiplex]|uniref:peptidylprolyl isomerase n=1 Tax=Xylaria multiplex TaxID=323545 RepID=A0A7C8MJN1_9PEZI|nr:hypothetical protein GQX73_g7204 [Xylaria multiplex]